MADPSDDTWSNILGVAHPSGGGAPQPPHDTLMRESSVPRSGVDAQNEPIAGTSAGPPKSATANPINGHEWNAPDQNDLQYACIFPLETPTDCTGSASSDCDCGPLSKPSDANPVCQSESGYGHTQFFAKAYPGLRELQVLHDFGRNSIVASICARNVDGTRPAAQDFGYSPAVAAIVERLSDAISGKCLPFQLTPITNPDTKKQEIPCTVVEARPTPPTGAPPCHSRRGRKPPEPTVIQPALARLKAQGVCDVQGKLSCSQYYFCELAPTSDTGGTTDADCHAGTPRSTDVPGWCYVDPLHDSTDNGALVQKCPPSKQQTLSFVDPEAQTPASDATLLIACFGARSGG